MNTRVLSSRFPSKILTYKYFEMEVEILRIRIGKKQNIETLISEETLLLAKFLRDKRKIWNPRISCP